jgi:hypothetical protein
MRVRESLGARFALHVCKALAKEGVKRENCVAAAIFETNTTEQFLNKVT